MCPNAVPEGDGTQGLQPLGVAGQAAHSTLAAVGGEQAAAGQAPTSVSLFDQGLTQVLQASVTGLRAEAALCAGARRRGPTAAARWSRSPPS